MGWRRHRKTEQKKVGMDRFVEDLPRVQVCLTKRRHRVVGMASPLLPTVEFCLARVAFFASVG